MANKIVCFCFGYGEEEIAEDVRKNGGRSVILEQIAASKRAGSCKCRDVHPEGR
ncbi:BFD-like (2Fe-2S) protein [Thermodesulforhabdus norvegica]|uniref:BFD-like (2Fe-2S) protein n=1 Tax=Thermodesulforhabdus norvegica TaxID=39841 RepID=A0A1I4UNP5_9BACT|nr:BFD-like (2Fe-2S) protein [Thermodesulforhabdus norvegica]SFM90602.1 hypothetical protein SAMN05660836_01900 [Thermodesulforhabdus norvegica]